MWETPTKQIFGSQNYYNTILQINFSKDLNTNLENTIQKRMTKHAICVL